MSERITQEQAIAALNAIGPGDPEGAHNEADRILLALVGPDVATAYQACVDRQDWWASA